MIPKTIQKRKLHKGIYYFLQHNDSESPIPSDHSRLKKCNSVPKKYRLERYGQGLVEVCVGMIFLVLVSLVLLDLGVLVLGGDMCGSLAQQAARAAGNASNLKDATAAVTSVSNLFNPSSIYKNLSLSIKKYDNSTNGVVVVACSVTIVLPVSVPFLRIGPQYQIQTQSTAPIVGIAPAAMN